RRRLRVELRGEDRQGPVAESLEGSVVQVAERRGDVRGQRARVDREPVILRRERDVSGADVLDRVVRAAMAELQLERARAEREAEELVPQADAEDGLARPDERFDRPDRALERGRIAGAVGEEDAVRAAREDRLGARRRGKDLDPARLVL